ncbi:hypothetical protein KAI87_12020, partial [Myxococcota bacterium]|nr:hypothetical protein [Myxococcota bacterium]
DFALQIRGRFPERSAIVKAADAFRAAVESAVVNQHNIEDYEASSGLSISVPLGEDTLLRHNSWMKDTPDWLAFLKQPVPHAFGVASLIDDEFWDDVDETFAELEIPKDRTMDEHLSSYKDAMEKAGVSSKDVDQHVNSLRKSLRRRQHSA